MTRLTDLPDVILLQIIDYLKPETRKEHFDGVPFYDWPSSVRNHGKIVRMGAQDIRSISLSCKKLQHVSVQALYTCVSLSVGRYDEINALGALTRSLNADEHLGAFIRTAHLDLDQPDIQDFYLFFFFPYIRSLSLANFEASETLELEDPGTAVGTSPLQSLYLSNCGAREAPLAQILSWPAALTTLKYECEQMGWEYHYEGTEPGRFSLQGVQRALLSQSSSLVNLVFSRQCQDHEGLGYPEGDDRLDLSAFQSLQSLGINHVFLVGWDAHMDIHPRLPKSLVELEMFYDDTGYQDFLSSEAPRPDWLFSLLDHKAQCMPGFDRIRITSLEWREYLADEDSVIDDLDARLEKGLQSVDRSMFDVEIIHGPDDGIDGAVNLIVASASADVSLSVFLHPKRRFTCTKIKGEGFESRWEASWRGDRE